MTTLGMYLLKSITSMLGVYVARVWYWGTAGVASVSRAQQLPHVRSEPAPASSKRDLLLARVTLVGPLREQS